jgi:hypothetical protein
MSHYIHHTPGRLRIKAQQFKRNERQASAVRLALEQAPGITAADINTLTGSVVINYDRHATNVDQIWNHLRLHGLIDAKLALEHAGDAVAQSVHKAATAAGKFAAGFVLEKVLERSAVALFAAVL